jgi:glycosyltransferase involved in cell wall biosynthesis
MKFKVCVVIPCYNVKHKIISVINKINFRLVQKVIIVDDCCPQFSGLHVKKNIKKKNLHFIFLKRNLGVGGATISGFNYALKNNFDIVIF